FDDLAVRAYAHFIRVRIGKRLNVGPAPTPAVPLLLGQVIDAVVFQSEHSVTTARPRAVMCGDLLDGRGRRKRLAVPYRFPHALGQSSGDLGRQASLAEAEAERPLTRLMPAAVLIGEQRQLPRRQIEAANIDVLPPTAELERAKFEAITIQHQSA